jgi:hypothetical protein
MRATILAAILYATAAGAASIDMKDPRRATGREDDVRIDAQLRQETVSSGAPVAITYQVQNLTAMPIAVATKATDVSYDPDTLTITIGIGSEVPADGNLPAMVTIAPSETKTFSVTATPVIPASAASHPYAPMPRYVQVKVSILRDVAPFATMLVKQSKSPAPQRLSDDQFDQWLKGNDTIYLNSIPVRYQARPPSNIDVENRGSRSMF